MKYLKKIKSIALVCALAFVSVAFAGTVNLPSSSTTYTFTISEANITEQWNQINNALKTNLASYTDIIIKVASDVKLDGLTLNTLDLQGKNLYFVGKTVPSNSKAYAILGMKRGNPLFTNVGKTVVVNNLRFVNAEFTFKGAEENSKGVLFDSFSDVDFVVKDIELENFKVEVHSDDFVSDFGILAGRVSGSVDISNVNLTNCVFDPVDATNVGSLIGSVNGSATIAGVQVSGEMNIFGNENDVLSIGIGIGGVIGSVSGNLSLDAVESEMKISAVSTAASSANYINGQINTQSGVGGIIGKLSSAQGVVNILGSEFSGEIFSKSQSSFELGIGGVIGLVKDCAKAVNVNNVSVASGMPISHDGSYAFVGGVVGAVANVLKMNLSLIKVEKQIRSISSGSSFNDGVVGGVLGASYNSSVDVKNGDVKSILIVAYSNSQALGYLYVGGLVGAFWSDDKGNNLLLENVSYKNSASVSCQMGVGFVNIGGLVGRVDGAESFKISGASVSSKSDVFDIALEGENAAQFFVGGLVGSSFNGYNMEINSSYVSGNATYSFNESKRNVSYISGLVGYAQQESIIVTNFMYEGDMTITAANTSDYLIVSGVLTLAKPIEPNKVFLRDGYVLCDKFNTYTNDDDEISTENVFINESYDAISTPEDVYSINSTGNAWYYESKHANLVAFCDDSDACKVPQEITFVNLKGVGRDVKVYSDNKGEWNLRADGSLTDESDFPTYEGVEFFANGDSLKTWKDQNGNVFFDKSVLADGSVFSEFRAAMPTIVFLMDSTRSARKQTERLPNRKIVLLDNEKFDLTKDSVLPTYVFENGFSNGMRRYAKSNTWSVLNGDYVVEDVNSLKGYLANHSTMDIVTLVADTDVDPEDPSAPLFQRNFTIINTDATFRTRSLGVDDTVTTSGNSFNLPQVTELEYLSSTNGMNCLQLFVNEVLVDTLRKNSILDMNQYADSDMIKFFGCTCPEIAVDTATNDTVPSDTVTGDSTSKEQEKDVEPVDRTPGCIAASKISDVKFFKSGMSAAKFEFKFNIPASCDMLTPSASVKGPNGLLWHSPFASKTKSYSFTYYPLEPGTYKFYVKLAEGKDTTFKKTFKADISVDGHKWSLAAVGTWPNGILKNGDALIYEWSQELLIGEYWQYEALPNVKDVVENVGYWIYAEKNLEFSLDLPLKKAESDSISWNLKKNFNGWNLLANPYSWDLEATSVKNFLDPESEESPFWRLNAEGEFEVASVLGANEAFWISTDKNRTIKVCTAPAFPSAASASKSLKKASPKSWSMALVAKFENGSSDSWNVLGVGSRNINLEEPPAGNENFGSVSFVGDDKALLAKRILAKSDANEYVWELKLQASESGKVTLFLDGLEGVRANGYRAVLVVDGDVREVGSDASVSVDVSSKSKKALLKVVPADVKVVALSGISDIHYSVAAGDMNVRFSVPFEMAGRPASAYLMDVNGKVVSKAYGKASAGVNALSLASSVRNGVYVLQVRVGNESRSVRIAL